ncbi:MAG: hypothetical protein ACHP93_03560 [Solirubrobacterales bacterium]
MAIGRLAIAIRRGAIGSLEVDDLKVRRLTIDELVVSDDRREQA